MTPKEKAEVVSSHGPFIHKHAKKWRHLELDDAKQEAAESLCVSLKTWNPEGGANIRTYASPRIYWCLSKMSKREVKRQGRHVSMDAPVPGSESTMHDILGRPPGQEDEAADRRKESIVAAAIKYLTPKERVIIRARFFEDMTLEEAGELLDVCRERARQIQEVALDKLRRRIEWRP